MKSLAVVMIGLMSCSGAIAQSAFQALGSKNIAAVTFSKGAGNERSLIIRTRKTVGRAHGYPAQVWTECRIRSERTNILGMLESASLRHYGVYSALGARSELPADILAADADQRGLMNLATMTIYQGELARMPWSNYESYFLAAASRLRNIDSMTGNRLELVLNSADQNANRRNANLALQYIGGQRALNQLMTACGTPAGLREGLIDLSLMN